MQLESTAKYSAYYYVLDQTAKQRYMVKLELVGALEDPYVERGIVSVDWNYWPQVEYNADIFHTLSIYTLVKALRPTKV